MNRRRFLASLAGVCGATLGGGVATLTVGTEQVAASARRRAPSEIRMGIPPFPATVAARTEGMVSVAIDGVDGPGTGRLVSERREPGTDVLFERVEGPRLADVSGMVTFEFEGPPRTDRWYYAVGLESEGGSRRLCESDPLRRVEGGAVSAPVADAPEPARFAHGRRLVGEGRYHLRHVWLGDDGQHWELEYAIAKSSYEIARGRSRGYVRSFADAGANRFAGRLGELIAREARPVDERRTGGLDEAEAFALAVRYVQSIQYALDSEVKGTHDYHRTVEETLVDCLADCKDATYLLSGLLSQEPFGYETALVFQSNHVLLGVRGADLPNEYGNAGRLPALDGEYVPIETTARWPVGSYPDRPVVAIFDGERWPYVNGDELEPTLRAQIDQFRLHYG